MREVEVGRPDWQGYFAKLASEDVGAGASVQVLPAPEPARRVPPPGWMLHGCSYDPGIELLELSLALAGSAGPGLRFFISRPRCVLVRESPAERSILILDANATRTLVCLRRRRPRRWRSSSSRDGAAHGRRRVARRPVTAGPGSRDGR